MQDTESAEQGDMFTDALLDLITGLGFERFADMRELLLEDPLAGECLLLYLEDTISAARYLRMLLLKVRNQSSAGSIPFQHSSQQSQQKTNNAMQQPTNQVKTDSTQRSDTCKELTGLQLDTSTNITRN